LLVLVFAMGGHIAPASDEGKGAHGLRGGRKGPTVTSMTTRLLMVCLGNICRSPTAEGAVRDAIARHGVDAVVESRSTAGWHAGRAADPRTIRHAGARRLDLRGHRARKLSAADLDSFDIVYAMDRDNLAAIQRLRAPTHRATVELFLDAEPWEVPDPWSGGPADFERVLDLCLDRADRLVRQLAGR
jgi:protein-tyrosine phosphatase